MPTDYKNLARPRSRRGLAGNTRRVPGWVWLVAGFVPGVLVTTWIYTNPPGPLAPTVARPPAGPGPVSREKVSREKPEKQIAPPSPVSAQKPAAEPTPPQPQYDFYTLLPEMEIQVPVEQTDPAQGLPLKAKPAAPNGPQLKEPQMREPSKGREAKPSEPRPPESRPLEPRPPVKREQRRQAGAGRYMLQAGSFSDPKPADRLKARLALLGLESTIQQVGTGPDEVRYRVHIGPFRDLAQIDKVRSQLKAQRIDTFVLRTGR